MAKRKRGRKKRRIGFGGLTRKLRRQGKSKASAKRIAASVARKLGKAPGQRNFKPRTKAGKKRFSKRKRRR